MAFPTAAATTLYTSFILFDPSPTDDHRHGSSPTLNSESQPSDPSDPSNDPNNPSIWENWSGGTRFGVLISILLFVAAIVLLSAWCCRCCCFKGRRGRHDPPAPAPANTYTGGNVALHNLPNSGTAGAARSESQQHLQPQAGPIDPDAPPPSYDAIRHDTIVPPSEHHRVGGEGVGEDEEFNVVADGKTPLSEIPFEDVDINALSQPSSASSASHSHSQGFEERHRWGGGDTTGHTNA